MTKTNPELINFSRNIIMQLCVSENNLFDRCFYDMHILPVEKHVNQLYQYYPVDLTLLSIAVYLHDISAIKDYSSLSRHHLLGAEEAVKIMKDKLEKDQLNLLEEIIINHNAPVNDKGAECLVFSNADAMAKFDSPIYWVSHVYKHRYNDFESSIKWYLDMLERTYDMMVPEAKKIIEPLYRDIRNNIFFIN